MTAFKSLCFIVTIILLLIIFYKNKRKIRIHNIAIGTTLPVLDSLPQLALLNVLLEGVEVGHQVDLNLGVSPAGNLHNHVVHSLL